jgi:hypothetical protein
MGSRGLQLKETRSVGRTRHGLQGGLAEGQQRIGGVGEGRGRIVGDGSDVWSLYAEVGRGSRDDDAEVARGSDVGVVGQVICVHGLAGTCRVVIVDRVTESLGCRGSRLYICSRKASSDVSGRAPAKVRGAGPRM